MSVDKSQVREDYIRGYSVRMLAAKYGVPKSTVADWVKRYGWVQESKPKSILELLEAGQKELSGHDRPEAPDTWTVSEKRPERPQEPLPVDEDYELLRGYTVKLLSKADDLLNLADALAPRDLKSLSSMLLDVRTLLNVMSPREAAEQELRLAALRKQAEAEDKKEEAQTVTVRFETEGAET